MALNETIQRCFGRVPQPTLPRPTVDSLRAARCALMNQRSQHVEDLLLLPTLLLAAGWGQPGTFVELGALDGLKYSNTFVLERCFNWTGVLIEANPASFEQLRLAPRPLSSKIHSAVCSGTGTVLMTRARALSPMAADIDVLHKTFAANETYAVPCRSLESIVRGAGFNSVDFLSLDVQGAEYKVLKTVQPHDYKV